jgi:hypothetical protein
MGAYSNTQFADLEILAEQGLQTYNEKYKEEFERKYFGQYVEIDLNTGKTYVGKTEDEARKIARIDAPNGIFLILGIGFDNSDRLLTLPHHE